MLTAHIGRLRVSARTLTTSACLLQDQSKSDPSAPRKGFHRPRFGPGHKPELKKQRSNLIHRSLLGKPWPSTAPVAQAKSEPNPAQDLQKREDSEATISLLEELFPDETSKKPKNPQTPKREIPYRPIGVTFVTEEGEAEEAYVDNQEAGLERSDGRKRDGFWRYQDSTLLVLSNAGKHLIYEDFKAALPTGRHLEGWTSGKEGMRVIRGRDRDTLLPNGHYFIMFKSANDADAFLANAQRLHSQSQMYAPKMGSLGGPLPPPPVPPLDEREEERNDRGIVLPGKSAHDELASYTLAPPSVKLNLRKVQEPFSPLIRDLVARSGYEQLVREKRANYEVLVTFDGWQPTLQAFKRAVNDDGKARRLHWDIENRSKGIRELLLPKRQTQDDDESESYSGAEFQESSPSKDPQHVWKRWLISFWREEEARRFVSSWHRRDIAPLLRLREAVSSPPDEGVIINAEIIW